MRIRASLRCLVVGTGFVSRPRGSGGGWRCGIMWRKPGRGSGGGLMACRAVGTAFAGVSRLKLGLQRYRDGGFVNGVTPWFSTTMLNLYVCVFLFVVCFVVALIAQVNNHCGVYVVSIAIWLNKIGVNSIVMIVFVCRNIQNLHFVPLLLLGNTRVPLIDNPNSDELGYH